MKAPDSFSPFFAEFYDILHAGLGDVDAYLEHALKYGPRVLELGSGTGRILVPLAVAGIEITGVDISDTALDVCRRKLEPESLATRARAKVVSADIVGLDLGETFDLVIAPCNLINYFTGPGEGLRLLRSARRHLNDGGVFILDCGIPDVPFMVHSNGVARSYDFTHPLTGTTVTQAFTATYDFTRQLEADRILLEERDGEALLRREETTGLMTYYFPRELRSMLASAGFRVFHEQGSMVEDVPIDENAGEMEFFCVAEETDRA